MISAADPHHSREPEPTLDVLRHHQMVEVTRQDHIAVLNGQMGIGFFRGVVVEGGTSHLLVKGAGRDGINGQAQISQLRHCCANTATKVFRVFVGWIVDPLDPLTDQVVAQFRSHGLMQRPAPVNTQPMRPPIHRRQAIHPCPAAKLHKKRLCLVITGVAQHNMPDPVGFGPVCNQVIPRVTGSGHEVALGFCTVPVQGGVGNVQHLAKLCDSCGFGRRLRP